MIPVTKCVKKPKVNYTPHPRFGTIFAPHVLRMTFSYDDLENLKAEIVPFEREPFSPATIALHYGQSIFEGMKAFRQKDGSVAVFRADLHAARFMRSAKKMAMPEIGEKNFLHLLKEYVNFEQESVPSEPDHALYLRPLLIGRDEQVKVGRSKTYTLYIMSAIAGSYFQGGAAKAARVLVNKEFVRAYPGGLGEVKTAANYAASLFPQFHAEKFKCDQVLYLDALEHEYVDELGGMNFFMVKRNALVTPPLGGTILPGVTRKSIIEIAPSLGLTVQEEPISFTEMVKGIQNKEITETFACGTAAVVHSIGELVMQSSSTSPTQTVIELPAHHPKADAILDTLKAMQRGEKKAPGDWLFKC